MFRSLRYAAPIAAMFVMWPLVVREVSSAPSADDAALKAIHALDLKAGFDEEKMRERCGVLQDSPDVEAEAALIRAAYFHLARIELAKDMGEPVEAWKPMALQAADDFKRAYACNSAVASHLQSAKLLLTSTKSSLSSSATSAREEIDKELADLVALEASHIAPTAEPAQMSRAPRARVVALDAGEVTFKTPFQDSYLGRLSLRVDLGFGKADLDGERDTQSEHQGLYFRTQLLARFKPGEQRRAFLLFGPYYNVLHSNEPAGRVNGLGDASLHGFGAHFELQWNPPRVDPWLSLHPFVDLGIEHVQFPPRTANISGFQLGGGAMFCIWHASFCPNVRLMTVPQSEGRDQPTIQVGMALDFLRFIDVGLSRRRSSADGQARTRSAPE